MGFNISGVVINKNFSDNFNELTKQFGWNLELEKEITFEEASSNYKDAGIADIYFGENCTFIFLEEPFLVDASNTAGLNVLAYGMSETAMAFVINYFENGKSIREKMTHEDRVMSESGNPLAAEGETDDISEQIFSLMEVVGGKRFWDIQPDEKSFRYRFVKASSDNANQNANSTYTEEQSAVLLKSWEDCHALLQNGGSFINEIRFLDTENKVNIAAIEHAQVDALRNHLEKMKKEKGAHFAVMNQNGLLVENGNRIPCVISRVYNNGSLSDFHLIFPNQSYNWDANVFSSVKTLSESEAEKKLGYVFVPMFGGMTKTIIPVSEESGKNVSSSNNESSEDTDNAKDVSKQEHEQAYRKLNNGQLYDEFYRILKIPNARTNPDCLKRVAALLTISEERGIDLKKPPVVKNQNNNTGCASVLVMGVTLLIILTFLTY